MDLIDSAIKNLKNGINKVWSETRGELRTNVYRGRSRSISTDVEDLIGLFVSDIFDNQVDILIDSSIHIDAIHRPDILVVRDRRVIAMIEVKTQMGWCRDASDVIDCEILKMHEIFCNKKEISCKFSGDKTQNIIYDENVKLFLVALTSQNGANSEQHEKNVTYARSKGVSHYVLFDGWYSEMHDKEIRDFAQALMKL